MSLDFRDYEEIGTKSRPLAVLWLLGDRLYYLGLFGSLFIVVAAPVWALVSALKGSQVGLNLFSRGGLAALLASIEMFFAGPLLKRCAREAAGVEPR